MLVYPTGNGGGCGLFIRGLVCQIGYVGVGVVYRVLVYPTGNGGGCCL